MHGSWAHVGYCELTFGLFAFFFTEGFVGAGVLLAGGVFAGVLAMIMIGIRLAKSLAIRSGYGVYTTLERLRVTR